MTNLYFSILIQYLKEWTSGTKNTITAYYMFMDNEFSLPTASGFPLKVALSGTFVPRAKGGLNIAQSVVNRHPSFWRTHIRCKLCGL